MNPNDNNDDDDYSSASGSEFERRMAVTNDCENIEEGEDPSRLS